jgi:hypothetical protein
MTNYIQMIINEKSPNMKMKGKMQADKKMAAKEKMPMKGKMQKMSSMKAKKKGY